MLVKEIMTPNPQTVSQATLVMDALKVMRANHFRRLPVMDKNNKIIDIVTDRDLSAVKASPATTLSAYELNYLLAKLTINDVITGLKKDKRPLITVDMHDPVDKAAVLLRDNKIGGLPVLDGDVLVGMITESDIFSALVEILGLQDEGVLLTIELSEDSIGVMAKISKRIADYQGNIRSIVKYTSRTGKEKVELKIETDKIEEIKKALQDEGFNIINEYQ